MNSYKFKFKIDLPKTKLSGELTGRSRECSSAERCVQRSIQSTLFNFWGIDIELCDIYIELIKEVVEVKTECVNFENPFRQNSIWNKAFELLKKGVIEIELLELFNKTRIEPLLKSIDMMLNLKGYKIIQHGVLYSVGLNKENK